MKTKDVIKILEDLKKKFPLDKNFHNKHLTFGANVIQHEINEEISKIKNNQLEELKNETKIIYKHSRK